MTDLLLQTGQVILLMGLALVGHAMGARQSRRVDVRYRYLPRDLDDLSGVDPAGLAALQRALA